MERCYNAMRVFWNMRSSEQEAHWEAVSNSSIQGPASGSMSQIFRGRNRESPEGCILAISSGPVIPSRCTHQQTPTHPLKPSMRELSQCSGSRQDSSLFPLKPLVCIFLRWWWLLLTICESFSPHRVSIWNKEEAFLLSTSVPH